MKNFVVVVDTQYDFMMPDGILYVNGAEETIAPMIQYLANLNPETTSGVLFTYDTHTKEQYEGSPESEMFPIHCELDTKGHKNVIDLDIVDFDIPVFTLKKPVFDMWSSGDFLSGVWENINVNTFFSDADLYCETYEIVDIVGVALNFCVKQAVDGFLARDYKVRLHTSMTRGIDTGNPGDLDARILYADKIAAGEVIVVE